MPFFFPTFSLHYRINRADENENVQLKQTLIKNVVHKFNGSVFNDFIGESNCLDLGDVGRITWIVNLQTR